MIKKKQISRIYAFCVFSLFSFLLIYISHGVFFPKMNTTEVTYASCSEVKEAGKAPLRRGEQGYAAKLDRDGDGVACE